MASTPKLIFVGIDVRDHLAVGRSSSAAKKAEAFLRVPFARFNSRFFSGATPKIEPLSKRNNDDGVHKSWQLSKLLSGFRWRQTNATLAVHRADNTEYLSPGLKYSVLNVD